MLGIYGHTMACDICGCANGNAFFGILPQSHRSFIGLRYRIAGYDSHLNSTLLKTHELFQTTELWGRFYPFPKVQVMAFLPYQINTQTMLSTQEKTSIQGLADATVLVHYNVLNTVLDTTNRVLNHNLLVGGGLKLPLGRYRYDASSAAEVDNPNFQLGTGSTDFLLNAIYTLRYQSWGINADASYKINTSNSNQYRFGNRFSTAWSVFYTKQIGKITLMPSAGIYVEHNNLDQKQQEPNTNTGGYWCAATSGLQVFTSKFALGISHQMPLAQSLAKGELRANQRLMVQLSFLF